MSANAGFQLFPPPPTTAVSPKRSGKSSTNPSRKPSTRRHAIQGVTRQSPPQSALGRSQSPTFSVAGSPEQYTASGRFSPPPNSGDDRMWNQQPQQQYSQPIPTENMRSQMQNAGNSSHSGPQGRPQTPLAQINTSTAPTQSPPRQIKAEPQAIRSIFPTYNPDIRLEHQDYYPTVHIGDERVREIPRAVLSKRPYSPSISDQAVPSLPAMKNQLQKNPSLAGTVRGGSTMQSPGSSRSAYNQNNGNASIMSSPPLRQGPTTFPQPSLGNGGRGNRSPTMERASTTEELKELWKVTNGWRVSQSEGRTFVLEMTSDPEEPVHTLSSAADPFYTIRIEPTSTSAHLTMNRHDPSKAASTPSPTSKLKSGLGLSSTSSAPNTKSSGLGIASSRLKSKSTGKDDTVEVLTTTLEESHRRLPPNDGLVALLYPTAASSLVLSHHATHPSTPDTTIRAIAERECARLVYDHDSQHYYLVHPCLSQPFIIRINKSPAWSKVEYTLEHPALPRDIARLVRGVGGVGKSWCVVDSGTAGGLDARFAVDVVVCALVVVAVQEESMTGGGIGRVERFEGPPGTASPNHHNSSPNPNGNGLASPKFAFSDSPTGGSPRFSANLASKFTSKTKSKSKSKDKDKNKDNSQSTMQEFDFSDPDLDLESQESFPSKKSKKKGKKEKEEKLPFVLRVLFWGFRCAIWLVSGIFGCAVAVVVAVGGCCCSLDAGK